MPLDDELRGLSPAGRRAVENGTVKVGAEISNAAYQWRFLAGMLGIPFIPVRNMMGTDTFEKSSAIQICDPWSGKPIALVPAAYPDVSLFHVPRCDKYGNAQIDGILVEDFELARASRGVIVSTEEIIDEGVIRDNPHHTVIPFYLVDAVCEAPFGAHPTLMPYLYYFDEPHRVSTERPVACEVALMEYTGESYLRRHGCQIYVSVKTEQ